MVGTVRDELGTLKFKLASFSPTKTDDSNVFHTPRILEDLLPKKVLIYLKISLSSKEELDTNLKICQPAELLDAPPDA